MKKLISILLAITLISAMCISVFSDGIDGPKKEPVGCGTPASTTPADWAKEDVDKALEVGILDSDKTYYYGSFITREEFCEIVDRLINIESNLFTTISTDTEKPFEDTNNPAVFNLYTNGIVNGKGNNVFSPNDLLTREEAAVIFDRLIKLIGCELIYTDDIIEYDDDESISDWAWNSIQLVSHIGLMNGYSGNVFYPKSNLSTEEAIVIVMRTYDVIEKTKPITEKASFADKLNLQMPNDKNYMFSPLSIKMALAMAANGAEGETKQEILDAVLINDLDEFNAFSKDLIARYSQTDVLSLNVANSIWLNKDNCPLDFSDSYKEIASEYFDAEAKQVDNNNAVEQINGWVSDKTKGKIPTIIEEPDFWTAIVNAIYFKGAWQNEFSKNATKPDTFNNANGTTSEIDFMNQTDRFSYAKTEGAEIVELPYKNRYVEISDDGDEREKYYNDLDVSMYLVKTESQNVEEILNNVDFSSERLKLSVPKFKIEFSTKLNEILENMGIKYAFDEYKADFSNMINLPPDYRLWIDKVIHKTYIAIDEEGTEAAAVTAITFAGATSAKPKDPIEVKFDEPFYFAIRDNTSGEILFIGRYAYAE